MKLLTILGVWALIRGASASSCNSDDCLRAVIGSAFPTRNGAADCSSYFEATVTPAVISTITKTTTVTATFTTDIAPNVPDYLTGPFKRGINLLGARQETSFPTNTPAYASDCSGTSRYSSACSCIGVKAATTTLPSKTTTTSTLVKTKTVSYDLPIFTAYTWFDPGCTAPADPALDPILFELGQCVNLLVELGISFDSFSPGSCKTTAAQCYILYYLGFDCVPGAGSGGISPPVPLEGCAALAGGEVGYFSGMLVCPNCTP